MAYGLLIGSDFDDLERPYHTTLPSIAFSVACCVDVNEDRPMLSAANR